MADNDKKETQSEVEVASSPDAAAKAKTGFVHTTAFKCIIVLLIIVIVCSVFLAIFNALFEVTDQERTDRAAKKIYGEKVTTIEEEVDSSVDVGNATVNLVYKIEEYPNDYLINVTGKGGYSGGTVTCYVVVTVSDDGEISLGNITISENDGQSFISNIKSSYLEEFAKIYGTETTSTDEYHVLYTSEDGFYINMNGSTQIGTGASYSWTAVCNAVNAAISYVEQVYLEIGGSSTGYSDEYVYTDYIDLTKTSHKVSGNTVTYTIITKDCNPANPFTIEITVGTDGIINSYEIIENGSTESTYANNMYADMSGLLVGLDEDGVLALIDPNGSTIREKVKNDSRLTTNATYSNFSCLYAALFATANYEQAIKDGTILPGGAQEDEIVYTYKDYTGYEFAEYIDSDRSDHSVMGDGTIVFNVVTTSYENANPFTVDITVGKVDGVPTILDYVIVVDGSNTAWSEGQIKSVQAKFIGMTLEDVENAMLLTNDCEYIISGEIAGSTLYNGSSESNTLCARAALFALANYETALPTEYDGFENITYINLSKTTYSVVGSTVIFTVVTGGYVSANPFTVEVTVAADIEDTPYIVSLSIIVDGSNTKWESDKIANLEKAYENLTAEDISGCFDISGNTKDIGSANSNGEGWMGIWKDTLIGFEETSIYNGSSESCFLVAQAALFALSNFKTIATEYAALYEGYENTDYINLTETTFSVVGDTVVFTVVTGGYVSANPFTVEVTVAADGDGTPYIVSLSIIVDGSNTKWESDKIANLEKAYENLTADDIEDCFVISDNTKEVGSANSNGEGWMGIWKDTLIGSEETSIYNGSSESCFLVAQAALFALSNFETIATEYAALYGGYGNTGCINLTETTFSVVGDTVVFTVVTGGYVSANPFTVEITVAADDGGTPYIVSLSIIIDGSNTKWESDKIANLEKAYENLTADDIEDCFVISENTKEVGSANSNGEGWMGIWKDTLIGSEETSIYNGSSESCFLVAQAALFALTNYNVAIATVSGKYSGFTYTEYINLTETYWTENGDGTVTYTVVTGTYEHAHPFTVEITVGTLSDDTQNDDGESVCVLSLTVVVDGSNEKWSYGQKYILAGNYVGMTLDGVRDCFIDENYEGPDTDSGEASLGVWKGELDETSIYNGSSESCFLVAQAALFALANFETIVGSGD